MKNFYFLFSVLIFSPFSTNIAQDFWEPTYTPSYSYSNVRSIAIDSSKHVYIGTRGGIFRSTDSGNKWTKMNNGLTNIDVYALAISTNGYIFAGTWEGGIFRSTDNGENWTQMNNGLTNNMGPTSIPSLASNSLGYVFVGTAARGVFRSTDSGNNWIQINNDGLKNAYIPCLAINPAGYLFAGTSGGGIFRSIDNGDNWTQINSGLSDLNIGSIAMVNQYIFAVTHAGIFRSNDSGNNWVQLNNGLTSFDIYSLCSSNEYIFAGTVGGAFRSMDYGDNWIEIYSRLPNTDAFVSLITSSIGYIFAGTESHGIFGSNDNGNSWISLNNGFAEPGVVRSLINSNGYLFASTSMGVFRSDNRGENWSKLGGLPDTNNYSLSKSNDGIIFASGNDTFSSEDAGDTWVKLNIDLKSITSGPNHYLYGVAGNKIFISDNSKNWTKIGDFFTYSQPLYVSCIAVGNNGYIYAATSFDGIFLSKDNGVNWSKVLETGLTTLCMIVDLNGDVYLGTFENGIIKSTDDGKNWEYLDIGLPNPTINAIILDKSGQIFAGIDNYHYQYNGGIYKSIDKGKNWNAINNGLLNKQVFSLTINSEGYMFAGTKSGIFRSINPVTSINDKKNNPLTFFLEQNYPNPFNPATNIHYSTKDEGFVSLKVFDVLGREVKTLVNEFEFAGNYKIKFNAESLPSGIYFYRLESNGNSSTKKMLLLK